MLRTIDLRGQELTPSALHQALPRAVSDPGTAQQVVAELIDDVRGRGEAALREQAERFDGGAPSELRVPEAQIDAAVADLDPALRAALDTAIQHVRAASRAQVPQPATTRIGDGAVVHQRYLPVGRVGLYVPGGRAVYPSSVVMNVVPAQEAGVGSIALASPPQRAYGGRVHPGILGAAGLLGVREVYAMGGAGAIGAFAHGVSGVGLQPVDVVTGPGNVYVAAAKRAVAGLVGIDAEAGTTEILVLADEDADPDLVAADLLSQAEHDPLAGAVLVTTSASFAALVDDRLQARADATTHRERVAAALSGAQSAIVLVDDEDAAVTVVNAYAPEHLEVQVRDPQAVLPRLVNAGAIFVGPYSPVSLGDYLAGSNHVLPTGGTARFTAGLSVLPFLRQQQVVEYDRDALALARPHIRVLAETEHLPAHADAVDARFRP
ncbi:histidinol dehydrogenase [uncultured Amnibacterium sp.]|uniref:histidinol dehydrogenase n=1 Tax=uncultured Amnibacterium sp. TaxID=1631851 RepID=UPI0035CA3161